MLMVKRFVGQQSLKRNVLINQSLYLKKRYLSSLPTMNRPRNRQPRGGGPRGGGGSQQSQRQQPQQASGKTWTPGTPQQASGTVPTLQKVVPGASVFIILKEDQPTGRETEGVVMNVLTSGNHPRGIKVRLKDGQVGRVQRMASETQSQMNEGGSSSNQAASRPVRQDFSHRYTDIRLDDEFPSEPPPRSLADFMPRAPQQQKRIAVETTPAVKCPFCNAFEGDEPAVTHHIEEEHLS